MIAGVLSFVAGVIFASLLEYWVHRLMHNNLMLGKRHREHHQRNEGQGVLGEFLDYVKGSFPVIGLPLLISVGLGTGMGIGMGWFAGTLIYAAFSAYAHQLQHENPTRCFWMKMPVHYIHHKYGMWNHNFGLGVDWWDHVFGTYKWVDWLTEEELERPERGLAQIRWV